MKKFRPFNTVSRGATQRTGHSPMTKIFILAPLAAVSLAGVVMVDCGSYSSPSAGAAGSTSNTSGGDTSTLGGAPGAGGPSGAAGSSSSNGGSTDTSSGGSAAQTTGGDTGNSTGGDPTSTGGSGGASGATTVAGAGGAIGVGGGGSGGPGVTLPCSVLSSGGTKCVSAHSTVRVIVAGYTGPLYQLCKGTIKAGPSSCKGTAQDIGVKDGYADSAAHDAFCGTGACKITKIYDQSGMKNDLEPAPLGGKKPTADYPADASAAPIKINGHTAYGVLITTSEGGGIGSGYRTGCGDCNIKAGNGMATGDAPQTLYWVTSQKNLHNSCCFDYGNAETSSRDDKNGTMEALFFGGGVDWGTGSTGCPGQSANQNCGPWVEADLEDGLYAGWENKGDKNISTNTALKFDFVTGVLLGDTADKYNGAGRFALYGGDATNGTVKTMYDGIRPQKPGYVPMQKKGSIILGIGGDNSNYAGGRFYEGAIATGPVISKASVDALQAAIVATKYGM